MMQKFKVGDYAHYSVGSDTYPVQVAWVSPNGKQVRTEAVSYELKSVSPHSYATRHTEEDCSRIFTIGCETTWKSRLDQPHKDGPGSHACKLHLGFSSYRDPSF